MKKSIRINCIHTAALWRASHVFWKEGPLLPRLLTCEQKPTQYVEFGI